MNKNSGYKLKMEVVKSRYIGQLTHCVTLQTPKRFVRDI